MLTADQLAAKREARWRAHAENTYVADLVDHNGEPAGTIVLSHPGQTLNRDPKFLREQFGIHPGQVITLAESRERPLSAAEKAAEAAAALDVAWVDDKALARASAAREASAKAAREEDEDMDDESGDPDTSKARAAARRGARNTAKGSPDDTAKSGPEPVTAADKE
jgi:hypothetical protein